MTSAPSLTFPIRGITRVILSYESPTQVKLSYESHWKMIRRVRGSATTRKAKKRRAHPPRPSCGRGRCFFPETDDREKTKIVPARSGTSFQDIYLTAARQIKNYAVWAKTNEPMSITNLRLVVLLFKNGPIPASFSFFSHSNYNFNVTNWKSVDSVHGIRTRGRIRNYGAMTAARSGTSLGWNKPLA